MIFFAYFLRIIKNRNCAIGFPSHHDEPVSIWHHQASTIVVRTAEGGWQGGRRVASGHDGSGADTWDRSRERERNPGIRNLFGGTGFLRAFQRAFQRRSFRGSYTFFEQIPNVLTPKMYIICSQVVEVVYTPWKPPIVH